MAGQYYDDETGLHYNYHRYYDPATGRYLSPDPIGLVGGINLYAYSGLNPINFIDQFGLYESSPWLMWVPGQHSWDRSITAFENDQYGWGVTYLGAMVGEQVLFALTFGESEAAQQCATSLSAKTGQFSDWFRTGPTLVPKQLVEGAGTKGAVSTWGVKGGGTNPATGFKLPFHYHIHKYNWYKPWQWFKQTPILK